jgi:hypothetical protein
LVFGGLSGAGYALSPIYRGLTIQFKVYVRYLKFSASTDTFIGSFKCQVIAPSQRGLELQTNLEGMIMGACLEADHRIREYEAKVRMQKRIMRDRAVWEKYEQEFEPEPPKRES